MTLGELLIDVLSERLSGWNRRDLKSHQFSALEAVLPSPDSHLRLLGEAPASTPEESDARRDAFISRFEASSTLAANPAKGAVAKEAFDSFVLAGILSNASVVSFPLQAFREMCLAYWLVQRLDEGSEQEVMVSRWRVVSFAAAVLRRSNSFFKYRDVFERYTASLLSDVFGVFAVASVVLESQDLDLALSFIEGLKKLGQHPFNRSGGIDRDDSSKAVAASIRLARNGGFDWFFSEYLDPRYPVRFAGSAILDWVFAEWLAQVRNTLITDQLDKFKTLVRPHIDASTFHVHGIIGRLSTVVPEPVLQIEEITEELKDLILTEQPQADSVLKAATHHPNSGKDQAAQTDDSARIHGKCLKCPHERLRPGEVHGFLSMGNSREGQHDKTRSQDVGGTEKFNFENAYRSTESELGRRPIGALLQSERAADSSHFAPPLTFKSSA